MKVGVVVGRFQIDKLHPGHACLLDTAATKSDVLVVVLGGNENKGSKRNPLDFIARKAMIEEWAKTSNANFHLVIQYLQDHSSDEVWSENLDRMVKQTFPGADITLFGGRDSFLEYYTGKLKKEDLTSVLATKQEISATKRREDIGKVPGISEEFRKGVIYGSQNTWPRLFMCVDIAVTDGEDLLLVGKRKDEKGYRFFGGFVDQADSSLEEAAKRELREEAGIERGVFLEYLGSYKINDYRYKSPDDGLVMTTFYLAKATKDAIEHAHQGDDIDDVVELSLSDSYRHMNDMVPAHHSLMEVLARKYDTSE